MTDAPQWECVYDIDFFLRLRESVLKKKKNKTHPNGSVYDDHFYNSFRGGLGVWGGGGEGVVGYTHLLVKKNNIYINE